MSDQSDNKISRRGLLVQMGAAGTALAAGVILGQAAMGAESGRSTVTRHTYGGPGSSAGDGCSTGGFVNVMDYIPPEERAGIITGTSSYDCTTAINTALGNKCAILFSCGVFEISSPLILDTGNYVHGSGKGNTVIRLKAGSNCDVFRTKDFDMLKGNPNGAALAPRYFGIEHLTIEGNYMAKGWREDDNSCNNTQGSAIAIYGWGYQINAEVYNIATHALYSECMGDPGQQFERYSTVELHGRISGEEAVVFRGPGDIVLDKIVFGVVGVKPRPDYYAIASRTSSLFAGDTLDGVVLDETSPYDGHCELGFVHIYGVYYGYGIRTRGVCRIKAEHLVSENNRGGARFQDGAWGVVSILEVHANGRIPPEYKASISGSPPLPPLEGCLCESSWGMQISGLHVQRNGPSQDGWPSLKVSGAYNTVHLTSRGYANAATGAYYAGSAAVIEGVNQTVRVNAHRINGDAVVVRAVTSSIELNVRDVTNGSGLVRDAGSGNVNRGNCISGTVNEAAIGFTSTGTPTCESIRLVLNNSSPKPLFAGSRPDVQNRAQHWDISAAWSNAPYGTRSRVYFTFDMSDVAEQTITVPHRLIYQPDFREVSWSVEDRSATWDGQIEYIRLQAADAANLVFKIKLSQAGGTGADVRIGVQVG
ncbi:hypothetical protein FE783_30490 [Paenibacillus mesophilus]|uniref:hypothetical protein n=1 Tax=Paenibacillus mesophilus TaxID=2582849 RepID=UPI00110D2B80|nr:hypothetical protein [Paenibacillus mesophilus]TMV45001.1 hypothetical protein FE783_30490 [Paenibacillus mesophilus]